MEAFVWRRTYVTILTLHFLFHTEWYDIILHCRWPTELHLFFYNHHLQKTNKQARLLSFKWFSGVIKHTTVIVSSNQLYQLQHNRGKMSAKSTKRSFSIWNYVIWHLWGKIRSWRRQQRMLVETWWRCLIIFPGVDEKISLQVHF